MDIRVTGRSPEPSPTKPPRPSASMEVKHEMEGLADRFSASRSLGNYASGAVVGAATETTAALLQAPRLACEIVENLWQAETIGPNLKILGTLAAVPGALLSIPVAVLYGLGAGINAVRQEHRSQEAPLKADASSAVARRFTGPPEPGQARTMTGAMVSSLEEFGSQKLSEGEKPHDVPILSPVFAVAGGVLSGAVSGAVGLVSGLVAGAITGAKDVASAFTNKQAGLGARIGKIAAAPLNLVAGPALAWKGLKRAVPQGLQDGWNHGPLRPIVNSTKLAVHVAGGVIHEAWEKLNDHADFLADPILHPSPVGAAPRA